MERLVFLHGCDLHAEQVWSTDDVSLELHEVWVSCLHVVVDLLHSTSDLFLCLRVNGVPWSDLTVIDLQYFKRAVPWEDQVDVIVLLSPLDDTRNDSFRNALVECVGWIPHPNWV